jgi:hypothetical protein
LENQVAAPQRRDLHGRSEMLRLNGHHGCEIYIGVSVIQFLRANLVTTGHFVEKQTKTQKKQAQTMGRRGFLTRLN